MFIQEKGMSNSKKFSSESREVIKNYKITDLPQECNSLNYVYFYILLI